MDHFRPKNGVSSLLWIRCKNFFEICTVKMANRQMKFNNNGLYQKKFGYDKWAMKNFGPENGTYS